MNNKHTTDYYQIYKRFLLLIIFIVGIIGLSIFLALLYFNLTTKLSNGRMIQSDVGQIVANFDPIKSDLENKILAEPLNQDRLYELAQYYFSEGNFEKSKNIYSQILKIDLKNWEAYNKMGSIFVIKEELDKAIVVYKKSIDINPIDNPAYVDLGIIYSKYLNDNDMAINIFNRAIFQNPKHLSFLLNFAFLYEQLGEKEKAAKLYQSILAIDPSNSIAINKIQQLTNK